ncbi:MAG: tyrosine-protein phosphatase [Eggerthella lenta]
MRAIDGGPLEGARLFRSASLSRITEHEAAFVVGGLGVRSIYDLRNRWEVASSPEPRIVGAKTLAFEPSTDRGRSTRLAVWWPASSASTAVRKSA